MTNIKQMKKKEMILAALVVLAVLFSFLSLAFYIFKLTDDTQSLLDMVGYGSLSGMVNLNGFDFINKIDSTTGVYKTYAVFDIVVLILSIAMMIAFVYTFLTKDEAGRKKVYKSLLILAITISVYTLIEGLHLSSKQDKAFWEGVGEDADTVKAMGDFGIITASYWPLIITAVIAGAYLLVLYKMPETAQTAEVCQAPVEDCLTEEESSQNETQNEVALSEENKVELLRKWKELLDDGVITQEEYEGKKQSFLK